jgi:two-component system NtrC family sensor kinase
MEMEINMNRPTVMVVEVEEVSMNSICKMLIDMDYIIAETATNSFEAISKLKLNTPDLVLMDIDNRSRIDDISVAHYNYTHQKIPIIYLTAHCDEEILERVKKTTPYGYIVRPFTSIQLKIAIEVALAKHNAEINLRKSERRYRSIFNESMDMIYMASLEGKIIDINPAGVDLLGYNSREELMAIDIAKNLYANLEVRERFLDLINRNRYIREFERELIKKNGEKITVLETASTMQDEHGNIIGYLGIVRDISLRIEHEWLQLQLNTELLAANEKLKQTQVRMIQHEKLASIGQLAAGVAHELNNPIGYITSNSLTLEKYFRSLKGYFELTEKLIAHISNTNPGLSEQVSAINRYKGTEKLEFILEDIGELFAESREGSERITSIVDSLRSFSRIDYSDKFSEYDINKAIETTLKVAHNEIKYVAEVETELNDVPFIICKGNEINQVLLNILVNSAQAISVQNRSEKGKIHIKTYENGSYLFCEITDDGPGIPQKIINNIFDPFFTTKEVGKGTGIGLSISYDIIVSKHHGELLVDSVEGKGTTFTIKLPLSKERNDAAVTKSSKKK